MKYRIQPNFGQFRMSFHNMVSCPIQIHFMKKKAPDHTMASVLFLFNACISTELAKKADLSNVRV